jgi:hypothetical protein
MSMRPEVSLPGTRAAAAVFAEDRRAYLDLMEIMGGGGGILVSDLSLTAAVPEIGGAGPAPVCAIASDEMLAAITAIDKKKGICFMADERPIKGSRPCLEPRIAIDDTGFSSKIQPSATPSFGARCF